MPKTPPTPSLPDEQAALEQEVSELRARLAEMESGLEHEALGDELLAKLFPGLEREFRPLIQGIAEVVWILRSNRHETLFVSPAFERVWGRSREEVMRDPCGWASSLHPDDLERMQAQAMHMRDGHYDEQYRIVRPDGQVRWIRDRAFPCRDASGEVVRLAGIASDITEQKLTEELIQKQQSVLLNLALSRVDAEGGLPALLERVTEACAHCLDVERVGVWLFTDDGVLTRVELYQKEQGEHSSQTEACQQNYPNYFAALHVERAIAADNALTDPRTREFADDYVSSIDIQAMLDAPIRVDGTLRGVLSHEHMLQPRHWTTAEQSFAASAADLISLAISNIEHQRATQESLRLESKFAQSQKMESLGLLAGGVAHDFNNLLQGILGNTELARLLVAADSPVQDRLQAVCEITQRAAELCEQLRAYSGQGEVQVEQLNLGKTVQDMMSLLETTLPKNCRMSCSLEHDLPLIRADITQVRQVVMNLITNASESLGPEPSELRLRTFSKHCESSELNTAAVSASLLAGRFVVFELQDSGCGMDAKTLHHMFDPFFSTKFVGRGLGLAATLGIMRTHTGAVKVESTPGQGTTVRLYFPALPDGSQATEQRTTASNSVMAGGTVLVVDDEDMVRLTAQALLEQAGYEVLLAEDGLQALQVLETHGQQIQCVLLDLLMPGLDGEQVLGSLRKGFPKLPVIISSGYSHGRLSRLIEGNPLTQFVKKPYDMRQLLEAVGQAIRTL